MDGGSPRTTPVAQDPSWRSCYAVFPGTMAKTKGSNAIDAHVGSGLRMRRIERGMTQEKLAAGLGLTFQQVQKYEKGVNRMGASRLQHG
jgi:DNA-binding XRE family transcriptional regulator